VAGLVKLACFVIMALKGEAHVAAHYCLYASEAATSLDAASAVLGLIEFLRKQIRNK
jgi:hypothetical protein